MATEWEEIGAAEANDYTPVHTFTEMGTPLIGKYKGQKEVKGGKFGDETHYIFTTLDASTGAPYELAVNPNFDLRKRLTVATVGQTLRITWVGEKPIPGKSAMKVFRVERTRGNVDVTAAPTAAPTAAKPASTLPF